jgi:hypothetical protein
MNSALPMAKFCICRLAAALLVLFDIIIIMPMPMNADSSDGDDGDDSSDRCLTPSEQEQLAFISLLLPFRCFDAL